MLTLPTINQRGQGTGEVSFDTSKLICITLSTGANFYRVFLFGFPSMVMVDKTIFEATLEFGSFSQILPLRNTRGEVVGSFMAYPFTVYAPFVRWRDESVAILSYENVESSFIVDRTELETAFDDALIPY